MAFEPNIKSDELKINVPALWSNAIRVPFASPTRKSPPPSIKTPSLPPVNVILSAVPPNAILGVPSVLPITILVFALFSAAFPANISLVAILKPPIVPPAAAVIVPANVTAPPLDTVKLPCPAFILPSVSKKKPLELILNLPSLPLINASAAPLPLTPNKNSFD